MAQMLAACFVAALAAAQSVHAAVFVVNSSEGHGGPLMRREQNDVSSGFAEVNPPEGSRSYSSIWGNDAVGTGHARSMLDSPQAWSAAANNQDQWMVIDMGSLKNVKGVYLQGRNPGSCCGNQFVTSVRFEFSMDKDVCKTYTPVEQNQVFATNCADGSPTKFLVEWQLARDARCVKIWVNAWSSHISMRAGLHARDAEAMDEEDHEFIVQNPPEASRSYSSVWDRNAVGTGHARSQLDSPQGWSAASNDKNQWVIVTLDNLYTVNGAYFQGRNKGSCCGNQIVTEVSFETSSDCVTYVALESGKVFQTNVKDNEELKRFVAWEESIRAKCVKILVHAWQHHITMRVGLSGWLTPGGDLPAFFATYGDGNPSRVAEDFPSVAEGRTFDFYGDGAPTHVA